VAINDVMEFRVAGFSDSEPTLNVFHYRVVEAAANAQTDLERCATWLTNYILQLVIDLTGTTTRFSGLEGTYIAGPTNLYNTTLTLVGGNAAQSLAPFVTFGFRYNRSVRGARNGYKRFSGIGEDRVTGAAINPTTLTALRAIAAVMQTPLTDAGGELAGEYEPVVVSRVLNGQPRPTPVIWQVFDVTAIDHLGTQNTRKGWPVNYRYVATLYGLVRGLCKLFGYAYPILMAYPFTPLEKAAIAALRSACDDLMSQGPLPG
jgi:hypothetical protein